MERLMIDSEKEYFFALCYTLENWEEGITDHLNCPAIRIENFLKEYDEKKVVGCRDECSRYLEYSPDHHSCPCPCNHFGSCEEAKRIAWEWIREKEKLYA